MLSNSRQSAEIGTVANSFPNIIVNLIGGIAAYCFSLKKPMINLERVYYNRLTLF